MTTKPTTFDRTVEDIGNISLLEHVNIRVPDLGIATTFFVHALGLTRDPFIDHGPDLVWFNVGRQQFHIPRSTERADILRGTIVLALPDHDAVEARLQRTATHLRGTHFSFERHANTIEVTGPWGNRFRCVEPTTPRMPLGMTSVELTVPTGAAPGIADFYRLVIGAPTTETRGRCAVVSGVGQTLTFVESDEVPDYDGHHIAIYVADFSGPHAWLSDHELIVEESDQHQYRFNWIVDPTTMEPLFELEHEVRSHHHPLRNRPLVNKNPEQRVPTYVVGGDAFWPTPV